jgi:hypothetical protein
MAARYRACIVYGCGLPALRFAVYGCGLPALRFAVYGCGLPALRFARSAHEIRWQAAS